MPPSLPAISPLPRPGAALAREARETNRPGSSRAADVTAMLLSSAVCAVVFFLVVERATFREMLGLSGITLSANESVLLPWSIVATTLVTLAPVVLLPIILVLVGWRRVARAVFLAGQSTVLTLLAMDVLMYRTFGLHLVTIVDYARLPHRWEVAGNPSQWVWLVLRWAVALTAMTIASWMAFSRGSLVVARSSTFLRVSLAIAAGVVWLAASLAPLASRNLWNNQALRERLYGALPLDLRTDARSGAVQPFGDPVLDALAPGLGATWKTSFPLVLAPKPNDAHVRLTAARRPNLIFIAVESFRHDALSPRWMPRLHAWSQGGMRSPGHHAGSIYSEAGLFSLLYGRSPLVFHATLDAQIPPAANEILGRSGYETAWFSGHPKVWMRREDYINPSTFDRFVHDDSGTWNDWDRRALAAMTDAASQPRERPLFALVFLMSTHFEYQYPPEYERNVPVDRDAKWSATRMMSSMAPELAPLLVNRYRNTLAFLDDLLTDTVEKLDPAENIIVITGDHGESIHDDGRYGHGYAFSDIVARVPLVIRGPGIPPSELQGLTLHADVLPTLLHAVEGKPVPFAHQHGLDLLGSPPPRTHALLAHCDVNREVASALLISSEDRLSMEFELHRPVVTVRGFEDPFARLRSPHGVSGASVPGILRAFDDELQPLRH